jgi:acetyl/propionyl-CoA carboxylase alpha subunit
MMGAKDISKKIMIEHQVPVVPGYEGESQDEQTLFTKAKEIGFPVMIKASLGGGGRGMRLAESESDFFNSLDSAKQEAKNAFGNDHVILEKFVIDPKHIEVQIIADKHGN